MKHRIIDSPVGPLTLVVDDRGALAALYTDGQKHFPGFDALGERDDSVAPGAVQQLGEYFAGKRTRFDLELAPQGTPFQHAVWAALAAIPVGETRTYGEVAADLGRPGASRAVGAATGRNPIGIIVPCHRLVGSTGALTGYAGGVDRKRWLLAFERGLRPERGPSTAG